ncbi:MAG: ISAzo13 family transposase, partial [Nitrospiraceae bacterium]
MDNMATIASKYKALSGRLDEATRRRWVAVEARQLGRGGVSAVAKAVGISRTTIYAGLAELDRAALETTAKASAKQRVRTAGGGRKKLTVKDATLLQDLDALVDPGSRGDPMSPLRWTCKSTTRLAEELARRGHLVSQRSVCDLLSELDFSLQAPRKTREGTRHPDRDAQFGHMAQTVTEYQQRGDPVISVDAKNKELVGDFHNGGREWLPKGTSEEVRTHDFIDRELGKVAPYGVYDLTANAGWVSVGIDHDTAEFAVESIRRWWREMGCALYPTASRLLITADGGGSNGYRLRWWRLELQKLADELDMTVQVCHFPPGTSQWNK